MKEDGEDVEEEGDVEEGVKEEGEEEEKEEKEVTLVREVAVLLQRLEHAGMLGSECSNGKHFVSEIPWSCIQLYTS